MPYFDVAIERRHKLSHVPVKSLENTSSSSKIYSYILLNGDAQVWDFDETGYNG